MQDLNDLFYFAKVVEHGSYAAAARALLVPKSRLSRRIIALAERLGIRLIQRSTRKLTITDIGQEYYRHCVAVLVETGGRIGPGNLSFTTRIAAFSQKSD